MAGIRRPILWAIPPIVVAIFTIGPITWDAGIGSLRFFVIGLGAATVGAWALFAFTFEKEHRESQRARSLSAELREATRKHDELRSEKASHLVSRADEIWRMPALDHRVLDETRAFKIEYDDPLHGRITLTPNAGRLLTLPIVRRLASVSQLPFGIFSFPAANHTRLQHCLGAAHLARTIMETLRQAGKAIRGGRSYRLNELGYSEEDLDEAVELAEITALLHDVGHGPFAHATDRVIQAFLDLNEQKPDVYYGLRRIRQLIPTDYLPEYKRDRIIAILSEDPNLTRLDKLIADLISGEVDVDRLDYLQRDALQTCMPYGRINGSAIASFFRAHVNGDRVSLILDARAASLIGHFVYARHMMYLYCYDDVQKALCERLLTRALWYVVEGKYREVPQAQDGQQEFDKYLERLMMMTDEELLDYLWDLSGQHEFLRGLVNSIKYGPRFRKVETVPLGPDVAEDLRQALLRPSKKPREQKRALQFLAEVEDGISEELGLVPATYWKIALAPGVAELKPHIDLSMIDEIAPGVFGAPKSINDVLPLLKRRPFKTQIDELLSKFPGLKGWTDDELARLNSEVMAIKKDLEGSPFGEAIASVRNRLTVYAHMDILEAGAAGEEKVREVALRRIKGTS